MSIAPSQIAGAPAKWSSLSGDDDGTRRVIASIQDAGDCWCGGTIWKGRAAMRISVSSCATTDEDVERSVRAILDAHRGA